MTTSPTTKTPVTPLPLPFAAAPAPAATATATTTSLQMQVATQNSAISSSTTSSPSVAAAAAAAAATVAAIGGAGNNLAGDTYTQLILDHPLYPLLEMVFQKCELATSSPRDSQAETICSSDSFSEDIRNFINTSRLRNEQLTTGCHDVDKFMLKSIEVLRIHLLELEKVHQLCDNFCQRYINCLKGKLPIDLVVDDGSSRDTNSTSRNGQQDGGPSSNTTPNNNQNNSSSNTSQNGQSANSNNNNNSTNTSSTTQQQQNNGHHNNQQHHNNGNHHHPHQQSHHDIGAAASNGYPAGDAAAAAAAAYHQSYGAYGPTGYAGSGAQNPYATAAAHHAAYAAGTAGMPHYQTAGDHHSSVKHESSNNTNHHHHHHPHHRELTASSGSSSTSSVRMEHGGGGGGGANGGQYGTETNSATTAPDRQLHDDVRSPTGSTGSFLGDASLGSGDGTECEDDDNRGRRQQKKRGIFPKAATNIMRAWLFQHLNHPYPSEDQKKQLAEETGLTILQVNNWFINARRRIVQPMIDQTNRTNGNIMAGGPAYSPDGTGMGYMLDGSQPFRSLPGVDAAGMGPLAASHAAMASAAMGAYSAASTQHLGQYGRQQQSHAAMLGLSTPPTGPHMMGAHPTLPPHDYY